VRFAFDRVKDHQRLMARHMVATGQPQQPQQPQPQLPQGHKQEQEGQRHLSDTATSVYLPGSGGNVVVNSTTSAPTGPPQYLAKRLAMLSSEEWLLNNRFDELSGFD
jgi:hypothetical protein